MSETIRVPSLRDFSSKDDRQTIEGRMTALIEDAAEDIERCGNTCDTYVKLRSVTKVLRSRSWNSTLADLATSFTKRKLQFRFMLSVHVSISIDQANKTLNSLSDRQQVFEQKSVSTLSAKGFRLQSCTF